MESDVNKFLLIPLAFSFNVKLINYLFIYLFSV